MPVEREDVCIENGESASELLSFGFGAHFDDASHHNLIISMCTHSPSHTNTSLSPRSCLLRGPDSLTYFCSRIYDQLTFFLLNSHVEHCAQRGGVCVDSL